MMLGRESYCWFGIMKIIQSWVSWFKQSLFPNYAPFKAP